jgi:Acetyltransferase (GNAT) domain
MDNTPTFIFRQPHTLDELEQLIRLRYTIFKTAHPNLFPDNVQGLDLDNYDPLAHHFGVYKSDLMGEQPVGYLRLIVTESTKTGDFIQKLAQKYGMTTVIHEPLTAPLPIMKYFPDADKVIGDLLKILHAKGEKLFEASRLCLLREVETLRLARFVTESTVAIFFYDSTHQNAIISHSEAHERLYESCFFTPCNGLKHNQFIGASDPRSVSSLLQQNVKSILPEAIKEKWQHMADEYKATGRIEYVKRVVALAA